MQKGRRHNRQLHNRPNIALRLAAVLLIMVCISTWMMDGLFAKYRTSDSGGDNARVIGFGNLTLTEEGDFGTAGGQGYFAPGMNLKKQATVTFTGSESATYVFMEAELLKWTTTDNMNFFYGTSLLEWSVKTDWNFLTKTNNTYVYYRELAPNTPLTADFIANDGKIVVSKNIKRNEITSMNGIAINLRASVVQSNGFATVNDAWSSISGN